MPKATHSILEETFEENPKDHNVFPKIFIGENKIGFNSVQVGLELSLILLHSCKLNSSKHNCLIS